MLQDQKKKERAERDKKVLSALATGNLKVVYHWENNSQTKQVCTPTPHVLTDQKGRKRTMEELYKLFTSIAFDLGAKYFTFAY